MEKYKNHIEIWKKYVFCVINWNLVEGFTQKFHVFLHKKNLYFYTKNNLWKIKNDTKKILKITKFFKKKIFHVAEKNSWQKERRKPAG